VNHRPPTCAIAISFWLAVSATAALAAPGQSFEDAKKHWAYQPISRPAPPKVKYSNRVQSPIDAFLLAKLEGKNLTFAPPADKRTLLRRVYYDLTGLPPTAEELRAFERDPSRNAFAKVVDRLLASPRYGERWGRHWLDVARYADTKDQVLAYGKDALRPFAYTYRDYVIRAFNEDLPFDQFIRDQLAADLVEPKVPPWRLAAMGFLTLGRLFDTNPHDQIDDQIDTTTRGFLGLTVACARCHDHKYDAILQQDYYALYGVFASTERPYDLPLIEDPKQVAGGVEFEEKLAAARKELEQHIDADFAKLTETFRQRIGDYLVRAATTEPDITETTQFFLSLVPEDFRPGLMLRTRRFLQQRAQPVDHIFGPWAELMALPEEKFSSEAAVAIAAKKQNGSAQVNPFVLEALAKAALTNKAAVARAYGQLLHDIYEESKKPVAGSPGLNADQQELLELVTGKQSPIWFPRRDTPNHMSRVEKDRYGTLVANLDKLAANATNAPPARAMIVTDLPEPFEPHIFKRGNPARLGEAVPRAFLTVLSGGQPVPFAHGSGRLELARAISSPANLLTARVFVNRVWMHHFGEPFANSTTDFGARNEPPANRALLDWLASEFIRSGWSVKQLHRVMVLSSAYQQASVAADVRRLKSNSSQGSQSLLTSVATEEKKDADNKLLSHYPRRRLDLEAMRDSLLLISGQLDLTMGGRSVEGASDPLNHRRTVYGLVDRQDLPAFYRAFDFAVPDQCAERRPRTTVPQQALFALNSAFVMEQARALGARPEIAGAEKPAQRVEALFRRVLGRKPTKQESATALRFVETAGADPQLKDGLTSWEQFAQVLLATNELLFLD
jgi:hypothetical protein